MPYSITNTKSLEQYEMNIPMFVPTPTFALELGLFDDRTATYDPYCSNRNFTNAQHPPAHPTSPYQQLSPNARQKYGDSGQSELFWISFSEVYLWPCGVLYFDNWDHLVAQLDAFNKDETYMSTSNCMKQANKWRKYEADTNTCWALQQILLTSQSGNQSPTESSYKESLSKLYSGATSVFAK